MTLKDKIRLIIRGQPILSEYSLALSEQTFKQLAALQFVNKDDMNPFSSSVRFVGYFHGYHGREFSIKPKSSFLYKASISNSIWIHGKIEPVNEQTISLKISYYRTNFTKYGQWVLISSLIALFLIISITTLTEYNYSSFLVLSTTLIFFYFSATSISLFQTKEQIEYFRKYFIDKISKK